MEINIKSVRKEEEKYLYTLDQNQNKSERTGFIGYLRGDFDTSGNGFFTTWFDGMEELKNDQFHTQFDNVINTLRTKEYRFLHNRDSMKKAVADFPNSRISGCSYQQYGFRIDTDDYIYFLRCNPVKGDYNFYCYCFQRYLFESSINTGMKGEQ